MVKARKSNLLSFLACYQHMIYLINRYLLALNALHIAFLPVCKNQRIQRHKSLARIASRGKSSMDWFYGCKLHVVMIVQHDSMDMSLT